MPSRSLFVPFLVAALGIVASSRAPMAAELIPGRCHMGACTWISLEEKDLVGTDRDGALFRVVTKAWQSQHPDGAYDRRAPRRGGGTATQYVLCAKTHPAILAPADAGRWDVSALDLGPGSVPPGVLETATALYFAVCHAVVPADTGAALEALAQRFAYPPLRPEAPNLPETVARPEAVLQR